MSRIRVLIVDDSVVIRKVVADELATDPRIETIVAANGRIALAKLEQSPPDLVVLDVEMPEMGGLETLAEIRRSRPRLPVIMFSAATEQGAAATLDALALGATDYFAKPGGPNGLTESRRVIREELLPAIKQLCPGFIPPPEPIPATIHVSRPRPALSRVSVLVLAASTGGPNALAELFNSLPAELPVPILIVQHMPPMFTRLLAERLTGLSRVTVTEAENGMIVKPGQAIIAPGDFHITLMRDGPVVRVSTNRGALENSCRPAADPLFRSAASVFGGGTLAAVLTGMGSDGLRGCEAIRSAGGQIVAQDEATSVVWGMPGAVFRAGFADKVLPLPMIGPDLVRRIGGSS